MSIHNICFFYKEVDKTTLVVIFKITKLLDCMLIGACAVIRSNIVCVHKITATCNSNTTIELTEVDIHFKVLHSKMDGTM